jgi:hypothetical protein
MRKDWPVKSPTQFLLAQAVNGDNIFATGPSGQLEILAKGIHE